MNVFHCTFILSYLSNHHRLPRWIRKTIIYVMVLEIPPLAHCSPPFASCFCAWVNVRHVHLTSINSSAGVHLSQFTLHWITLPTADFKYYAMLTDTCDKALSTHYSFNRSLENFMHAIHLHSLTLYNNITQGEKSPIHLTITQIKWAFQNKPFFQTFLMADSTARCLILYTCGPENSERCSVHMEHIKTHKHSHSFHFIKVFKLFVSPHTCSLPIATRQYFPVWPASVSSSGIVIPEHKRKEKSKV